MSDHAGALQRRLKKGDVVALAFGAMIGWSWVLLTGEWIAGAGTLGAVIAFVCGSVVALLIGLNYAELVSAMPQAGGEHVYAKRAIGRGAGFFCTWAIVLGYVAVVAFEAVALPFALAYLIPEINQGYLWTVAGWDVTAGFVAIGIGVGIVITVVNIIGIRPAAVVQTVVTAMIGVIGLFFLCGVLQSAQLANLEPLFAAGSGGVLSVLVIVPIMLVGFDVIPQAAEEINLPTRQIGLLLIFSLVLACLWYALMIAGVGLTLDEPGRLATTMSTAEAASAAWGGDWAGVVLVLGGIAGIVTSWNAFLLGGSRAIFALARDGILPPVFARTHPRFGTPYAAIMLIGGLSLCAPWFGRPLLVWLLNAGSFGVVLAYVFVALSFLVLRYREPEMERPFTVPMGWTIGLITLFASLALVTLYFPGSPAALSWPQEWIICAAWFGLGIVLYGLASRARAER